MPTLTPTHTVTLTKTVTPTPQQNDDFIGFLTNSLDLFKNIKPYHIETAIKMCGILLVLFWFMLAFWVFFDSIKRYKKIFIPLFWLIFVIPFNLPCIILYIIMRPVLTTQEKEWSQLEMKYLEFELLSAGGCPRCEKLVHLDHAFCWNCGYNLRWICLNCNSKNAVTFDYCVDCGKIRPDLKQKFHVKDEIDLNLENENKKVLFNNNINTNSQNKDLIDIVKQTNNEDNQYKYKKELNNSVYKPNVYKSQIKDNKISDKLSNIKNSLIKFKNNIFKSINKFFKAVSNFIKEYINGWKLILGDLLSKFKTKKKSNDLNNEDNNLDITNNHHHKHARLNNEDIQANEESKEITKDADNISENNENLETQDNDIKPDHLQN